jgi:TrmH family RNA methyltransferase
MGVDTVLSKDNKYVKYAAKLKQKKYRDTEDKFLIEGLRFVEEAINEGAVQYILYSPKIFSINGYEKVIESGVEKYEVSEEVLNSLCDTENPQGIAAVASKLTVDIDHIINKDSINTFIVIADGVQDPGNFGTIIRTADAAGADAVVAVKGTVDMYNSKTLRATMGSIFHIPVIYYEDFEELAGKLRERGCRIFASTPSTDKYLYDCDFTGNCAVVIGNEANGIPDLHMALSTDRVKIPMAGRAESLNAGAAGAILIYEVLRQRL